VERGRHHLADLRPPDIGLLGYTLNGSASTTTTSPTSLDAWLTVIVMDVWHWTSLVALLVLRRLKSIPDAYYQAARSTAPRAGRCSPLHPAAEDERACC
jgi:ABC-type Fe3+ transport system permease subunit